MDTELLVTSTTLGTAAGSGHAYAVVGAAMFNTAIMTVGGTVIILAVVGLLMANGAKKKVKTA
ncbi:MAG: hypothetical protein HQL11_00335 [Candidatus Omnitrophica bacterium]|nr:hypothetical protein [Candidatus Omnitrophota bacterium]